MSSRPKSRSLSIFAGALVAVVLVGCAAQQAHERGMKLIADGQRQEGLAELQKAIKLEPTNALYRIDYRNQLAQDLAAAVARAELAQGAGDLAGARAAYAEALRIDPSNESVRRVLAMLDLEQRMRGIVAEADKLANAGRIEAARDMLRSALADNPASQTIARALVQMQERVDKSDEARQAKSDAASVMKRPVTLQFRDANLRMVFEALSRTTGLNVILDRDVRADLKTTIFVRDASVDDTVSLILLQNQLEKKVLNANTLFIYPATAVKQKEYQDLKVRTFQLSNADAKHVQNVLKTVLKVKDMALDERTNTLVIRDTAAAIAVAEKVVLASDLADAEVMMEVQLLEVTRERLTNLGLQWPNKVIITTPPDRLTISDLQALSWGDLRITPLAVGINLQLEDSDANLLASPRIRVRDREKARILIGDKVPVITNTVTPVASGSSVVTGQVQYLDVGIKLEVEPRVYLEGDIGIKLNFEISNIVKQIGDGSANSTLAYQIGTRGASTTLRLRDGETQILGGLISDLDRTTAAKVPGLWRLPVLGRLFRNDSGTNTKTEIVLSITPRIVRGPGVAEGRYRDVFSGTDAAVRDTPLRLDPVGAAGGVSPGGAPVPSAAPPPAPRAVAPAPAPRSGAARPPAPAPPAASGEGAGTPGQPPMVPKPDDASPAAVPGAAGAAEGVKVPAGSPGSDASDGPAPANDEPQQAPPVPAPTTQNRATTTAAVAPSPPPAAARGSDGAAPPFVVSWMGPFRVKIGEEFKVTLRVNSPSSLRALPLDIRFDPQVLTFVDAQPGEFMSRAGMTAFDVNVDASSGLIRIVMRGGEGQALKGQGDLVTLRFTASTPWKQTQLSVTTNELKDDSGAVAAVIKSTPLTLRVNG